MKALAFFQAFTTGASILIALPDPSPIPPPIVVGMPMVVGSDPDDFR